MTDRPDINAVLEYYGGTTKSRSRYNTSCVFHEDKTPSLSVNTDINVWSCKSCGQDGDSFTMIALKEGIPLNEFRRLLDASAALGLAAGSDGGSGGDVSGGDYAGRRRRPKRSGDRPKRGGYVPAWRRE